MDRLRGGEIGVDHTSSWRSLRLVVVPAVAEFELARNQRIVAGSVVEVDVSVVVAVEGPRGCMGMGNPPLDNQEIGCLVVARETVRLEDQEIVSLVGHRYGHLGPGVVGQMTWELELDELQGNSRQVG